MPFLYLAIFKVEPATFNQIVLDHTLHQTAVICTKELKCPVQLPKVVSCVLCLVSFYLLFISVFAEGVFVNAKMNFQVKKHGKYFGIYDNYFSKNMKNKEIKRHKTQDKKHKTQDTTGR